jgi:DNA-binding SARP family transcriptional activator
MGDRVIDEAVLSGSQGRLVFAMLAAERRRAVTKDELAEELWGERLPSAWEQALWSLISKTRAVLSRAKLGPHVLVAQGLGCYQLTLPHGTWVDLEAAADAVHRGETTLRASRPSEGLGHAHVALAISRRPLLAGHDGTWVARRREELESIRLRALECKALSLMQLDEPLRALSYAQEAVQVAPFSERSYRLVMRAHLAAGNRAEALRSYQALRAVLADELGVPPAAETASLYQEALSPT